MTKNGTPQKDSADSKTVRTPQRLLPIYPRYPVTFESGAGVYLYDDKGRAHLDLVSGLGVNAMGHAHPRLVPIFRDQAAKLVHLSNHYDNRYPTALAERLCDLTGMAGVFFSTGGTEAVEGAIKLARLAAWDGGIGRKSAFVSLRGSYHGRTYGALSVTGQDRYRQGFEPGLPDIRFVDRNDIDGLRAAMDNDVCGILIEPLQGEGGVWECTTEYLAEARRLADEHHALLIYDEIQSGLGRTGDWFAYERSGVRPDVLIVGKPLGGGLPLSAFLVTEELFGVFQLAQHGSTLGGSPLASRLGLEFLSFMESEGMLHRIHQTSQYMQQQLQKLVKDYPVARAVRGRGLLLGLEISQPGRPIAEAALQRGLLLNVTQGNIFRFLPPYILEPQHVDQAIGIFQELLTIASEAEKACATNAGAERA